MASLGAYLRLFGAGWTLVRNDALLPRELDAFYSPAVRFGANALRVFSTRRSGRPGERLARSLEGLGPVAIKLGQLLSTRGDIFGRQFAEDMGHLKDRLPAFPMAEARATIAQELGQPVEATFATFGEPVAAASLAQAHLATLLDGRQVAVKVLRPGIERRVAADSAVLALASRLVERWGAPIRRLEPVKFADTVIRATELELDLRLEAAGADELAEVMAKDGYMSAPKVLWEGVGKRVLTLEWADGMALSDEAALSQPGLDRKALADNLTRAFLAQALDHASSMPTCTRGTCSQPHRRSCKRWTSASWAGWDPSSGATWRRSCGASCSGTIRGSPRCISTPATCRASTASPRSPRRCGRWASRCSARRPMRWP
jgi:ubiquinone biosynthesis protein